MTIDFKHANPIEGVRFTAQIGLPNVVLGLFKKREELSTVAGLVAADHLAYQLVQGLVQKYGPDPFYIRVATEEALLVHHPVDLKIVLGGSPVPFAADPDAKKKGMAAFQPDALTLSRGDLWENRRRFAEAVLDTGKPLHRQSSTYLKIVASEADALLAHDGPIEWDDINRAFQRITRRVVFGDLAADDTGLTSLLGELMAAGNKMPGEPADGYDELIERITLYLQKPARGSLASLVASAPSDPQTEVAGQLIHWLFAMGDTLPANLFRALALLATHPLQMAEVQAELKGRKLTKAADVAGTTYLAGCIQDTMRLWPTTAMFGRVTTEDVRFPNGEVVKEGTQVLIHNLFNHRNRDRLDYADRFAPEEWQSGDAGRDWAFNFLSHGPQGCPGAGLSIFLGQALLAQLVTRSTPKMVGRAINPNKHLPYTLDIFRLRINLSQAH